MSDQAIPDKPGLWWVRYTGPIEGVDSDYAVRVQWEYFPDGQMAAFCPLSRKWVSLYRFENFTWLGPVLTWLGPVLTYEQINELQRHAAALEAQVTDLECTVVRLLHDRALDSDLNNPPLWECEHENMNEAMRDE